MLISLISSISQQLLRGCLEAWPFYSSIQSLNGLLVVGGPLLVAMYVLVLELLLLLIVYLEVSYHVHGETLLQALREALLLGQVDFVVLRAALKINYVVFMEPEELVLFTEQVRQHGVGRVHFGEQVHDVQVLD